MRKAMLVMGRRFAAGTLGAVMLGTMAIPVLAEVEMKSFAIWTSRDSQQGGLPLIAAKKGFFTKEGLDVEVKFVSAGSEIPAGMVGGTILVGIASWVNPLQMKANGLPAVILAQATDQTDTQQLVVKKSSSIKSPKDLNGKKLGITKIGVMLSLLDRMCREYGCDSSKIRLVNMLPQDILLAYKKDDVDAILTWEPYVTYAALEGGVVLASAEKSYMSLQPGGRLDGQYAAVFALRDFVSKNPKTVEAMLKGLRAAAEWTNANKKEAGDTIATEMNIPTDIVQKIMTEVTYTVTLDSTWAREFDGIANYLLNLKELKGPVSAKDVFFDAPLKSACAACVK
jgi:ABC-type nitrate/sulfonate/bicarbonate transport system substrate-binding protein